MIAIEKALETMEGDGAEVKRLFPLWRARMNYDPFVLFDHFHIAPGNGFPSHPHRGFEAITYLFEGAMSHADNLGNESTVSPGGAQRFTAGRGLVHSEMPGAQGATTGIQLWINLPQRLKGIEPSYQQVDARDLPQHTVDGCTRRIIVGEGSPLRLNTPVDYQDIEMSAKGRCHLTLPAGQRGVIYVVSGSVDVEGHTLEAGTAALIEQQDSIDLAARQASRVVWCSGPPHGEAIRQHGPYVD